MKRIDRKWLTAFHSNSVGGLLNTLMRLKVIKQSLWSEFYKDAEQRVNKIERIDWERKWKQERTEARNQSMGRAPKNIRPNKAR